MIWIKGLIRLSVFCLLLAALGCFITSNTAPMELSLFPLPYTVTLPAYALGLIMLCFGLLLGAGSVYLRDTVTHWKSRREHKHTQKKIAALEQEVNALRMEKQALEHYSPPQPTRLVSLP